jgi:plasmid stabilization system protein ParE
MKYRVEITATALAEVQEAYAWLAGRSSAAAGRWRAALLEAVDSLERFPERCPLAPESDHLGREIPQLLHGKRRGVYRILFEIRGRTVYVLRVRHGSRPFLGEG